MRRQNCTQDAGTSTHRPSPLKYIHALLLLPRAHEHRKTWIRLNHICLTGLHPSVTDDDLAIAWQSPQGGFNTASVQTRPSRGAPPAPAGWAWQPLLHLNRLLRPHRRSLFPLAGSPLRVCVATPPSATAARARCHRPSESVSGATSWHCRGNATGRGTHGEDPRARCCPRSDLL